MIIQDLLTNPVSRPQLRSDKDYLLEDVRGIVVHFTANASAGAGARRHINYFNHTKTPHSAHYFVDSQEIIQAIPDHEMAFHVGDNVRDEHITTLRQKVLRGTQGDPNRFLIGIEMCVNVDSDWTTTVKKTIYLIRKLMAKYFLEIDQVYRHYDITGKEGPMMFLPQRLGGYIHEWNWDLFRSLIDLESLIMEYETIKEVEKPLASYELTELFTAFMSKFNVKRFFR